MLGTSILEIMMCISERENLFFFSLKVIDSLISEARKTEVLSENSDGTFF